MLNPFADNSVQFDLETISLRFPEPTLIQLKVLANERDVLYQSLLKIFLKERL